MRNRLRELRVAAGMSQLRLSKESGVTRQTIRTLESNPDGETTTRTIEALCKALGVRIADFFGEDV